MSQQINKIVIVGRDIDAWLSAFTLQLALSKTCQGIEIELLELPSELTPASVFTTLPAFKGLHDTLGMKESQILSACSGLVSFAQRYSNWSGASSPFMHAYDTCGLPIQGVSFLQYWLKAQQKGLNVALEEFSLGALAAKQGNYVMHNEKTLGFSSATRGYHLSATHYVKAIASAALSTGLLHQKLDALPSVDITDGIISSVTLSDGKVVEGDLFIDASGSCAHLMNALEKDNYNDWSQWFPCDFMVTADAAPLNPIPAFAQISAFKAGWFGLYPLANRTAVMGVFDSKTQSYEEALETIQASSGMQLQNVEVSPLSVGARQNSWVGNCIALGTSAANLDLLDGVQLSPLQLGLTYLMDLFPVDKDCRVETAVFNRKVYSHVERIRDFQLAHYKLNRRMNEPFWDKLREQAVPASLEHKIALFRVCGKLALEECETFKVENWTSIFIGHGLVPETYSPLVENVPEQDLILQFQKMLKFVADEVSNMPSLQTYMEMHG